MKKIIYVLNVVQKKRFLQRSQYCVEIVKKGYLEKLELKKIFSILQDNEKKNKLTFFKKVNLRKKYQKLLSLTKIIWTIKNC